MKIKNKLSMLIKASAFSRKLSKALFSIFVIFSAFLILLSVCLIFPLADNIENKINNHPINRELYLEYPSIAKKKHIKEDIAKMKKVEHVTSIYAIPPTFDVTESTGVLKSNYVLDFLHKEYTPVITNGRSYKENERNVALIPDTINDFDDNRNEVIKIQGKDLIGKNLKFTYMNDFTYTVEVVGTYDTTDPIFDGNEILVPRQELHRYKKTINKSLSAWESPLSEDYFYYITVDHYKNKPQAQKELSAIRQVDDFSNLNIDEELYNTALVALIAALAVFAVMITAGLFIFLQSNIKNRTKELALYRSIGYKSKHLLYILFSEHLIFGITALSVGITTTALLNYYVINPYLYTLVGNTIMEMTAEINIIYILVILIFFIAILYFVCRQAVKRSEKIDLTILLKEH